MYFVYYNAFKHYTLTETLVGAASFLFLIGMLFLCSWMYDKLTTYIKDRKW